MAHITEAEAPCKINKKPFIEKLAKKRKISKEEAAEIYDDFIDLIKEEVLKGNELVLTRFGSFSLNVHQGHYIQRNGEKDAIDEYLVFRFKPASTISKQLSGMGKEDYGKLVVKVKNREDIREKRKAETRKKTTFAKGVLKGNHSSDDTDKNSG